MLSTFFHKKIFDLEDIIMNKEWFSANHLFLSSVQSHPPLCDPMDCSTPGLLVHHQVPEFTQTHVHESVMPSNHLILCRPLLLLPSIFPSIRVFCKWVDSSQQPKYQSFGFSISPPNEYSALISFRIDWFDLLAIQGTLKSLLQHHNLKASSFHGPTLKSIHDYWKNHSSDYMDVCWQNDVSAF